VARASQNSPELSDGALLECRKDGWGRGSRGSFEGPQRLYSCGGDHQLDRLVTIGGERGEGSDEREPCGMQKDPTINQETR